MASRVVDLVAVRDARTAPDPAAALERFDRSAEDDAARALFDLRVALRVAGPLLARELLGHAADVAYREADSYRRVRDNAAAAAADLTRSAVDRDIDAGVERVAADHHGSWLLAAATYREALAAIEAEELAFRDRLLSDFVPAVEAIGDLPF